MMMVGGESGSAADEGEDIVQLPGGVDHDSDDFEDVDSGASSGESTATTSISSSVFNFRYANGRRYASDRFIKADYYLPNDEVEQDRLDLYHHIFLLSLGGKLYVAPLVVEDIRSVLDVGTGTGIWAIDFADEHPHIHVIGNDISPIQPHWVPDNLTFEVDDVEEDWTYKPGQFDYIHLRSLSGFIHDWGGLLRKVYRSLSPGGYIEFQDYGSEAFIHDNSTPLDFLHAPKPIPSSSIPSSDPVIHWLSVLSDASTTIGRPLRIAKTIPRLLTAAGFTDIAVHKVPWPLSPWPEDPEMKDLGQWLMHGAVASGYPFALGLLGDVGWREEGVKELCDAAIKAMTRARIRYYVEAWFIVGRKPVDSE